MKAQRRVTRDERRVQLKERAYEGKKVAKRVIRMNEYRARIDQGCWIMLIKRLPTNEPPPPLSMHFSHPWPMSTETQEGYLQREASAGAFLGMEPNPVSARKISWKGEELRVFEHEYSKVTAEKMHIYLHGIEPLTADTRPSHFFHSGASLAEKKVEAEIITGERRPIYDAALVDGATPEQAYLVALEIDPLAATEFPPPVGWYECQPEYVEQFF